MSETEAVLLKRFVHGGDAEAFAEIIRRYAGLVYSAALRVLADVDRASDVAQDTFLQLAKDAGTVTGSLPGWLHRVATHKAIDQVRRDATRKHREAEYVAAQPHETAEWKEISPYVDEGLNLLDPQLRNVLISHFLEGRSTRAIARVQGLSQATISRRIEAGVEQLRAGLRRRGVLVAAGALGVLLGENAVQAAPPLLLTELGKIALISGSLVTSAAATGAASSLSTVAAATLTVIKANVMAVAVAAVVVIGAGSVLLYQQMAKSPRPPAAAPVVPTSPAAIAAPDSSEELADGGTRPPNPERMGGRMIADAAQSAGSNRFLLPNPARQGLPGPEAETDPRLYVPGRDGGLADSSDDVIAAVSAQPPAETSDRRFAADDGLHSTDPAAGRGGLPCPAVSPADSSCETAMKLRRATMNGSDPAAASAGPVVAGADLRFVPPLVGNPGGILGLQRQNTTTVRPAGMIETPPDAPREPAYFVILARHREMQGILYRSIQSSGQVVLLLDTDGDGLWSDERAYVGTRLWMFSMTAAYEFGPVYLKQSTVEPGGEAVYAQYSDGKWLSFWPAFYRAGEVLLDGRTHKVSLVDADFDGRFNESIVLPVAGSRDPDCDVLAIDLDGDLKFRCGRAGDSEILPLGRLVDVGGRYYSVHASEDGSTIEFRQAEPIPGQTGLDAGQSASDLTRDASVQRLNEAQERSRSSENQVSGR